MASLGIVLLCTLMCTAMLVALVRSARVQTAALSVLSEQLSRGLGVKAGIGNIDYKFPNRLLLTDFLIEDRQRDTLLHVDTLSARADLLKFVTEDTLCIYRIDLSGGYFNAYLQNDSTMNYQFLVDAFGGKEMERDSDFHINLQVHDIRLARMRTRFNEWYAFLPAADMHVHNITPQLFDVEISRFSAAIAHNNVPLDIQSLQAHFVLNDTVVTFPKLHARLPQSDINVEQFAVNRADAKRLRESLPKDSITRAAIFGKTAVSLNINEITFTPYDFRALVPRFTTMKQEWAFSAEVQGRVDSLEANRLNLRYRRKDLFTGNVTMLGLPDADSMYVRAQCQDFHINRAVLQDIISGATGKPVVLPPLVGRLGDIHYRGALQGRADNLVLKGAFTTALGSMKTDGHAILTFAEHKTDTLKGERPRSLADINGIRFNGSLSTKRFYLGKALAYNDLGTVGLTVNANGEVGKDNPFIGDACVNIDHITFHNYTYRDIHVDGTFRDKIFAGEMHSDDPNLNFAFNGSADISESSPDFDFSFLLSHFRPGKLNLSEKYADSDLRLNLNVKLKGTDPDHITGQITLSDVCFSHNNDSVVLHKLTVRGEQDADNKGKGRRLVRVDSEYLTASFTGSYRVTTIATSVLRMVADALPSVFPVRKRNELLATAPDNNIDFYIYARNLDRISRVLELPVTLSDRPTIKGYLHDKPKGSDMSLQAIAPDIIAAGHHIEDFTLSLTDNNNNLACSLFALHRHGNHPTAEHIGDIGLYINAKAAGDSLSLLTDWSNPDTIHTTGEININTRFARYADQPLIAAEFLPSKILLSDSLWTIHPSRITYCAADTTIDIEHFLFASASQHIYANGIASTNEKDTIFADLKEIDLDYILGALTDIHKSIYFGGTVSGWAKAYGILRKPMFEAEVEMEHAKINGSEIGDIYAGATLDSLNHVIIRGDVYDSRLNSRRVAHVDGNVGGANKAWEMNIYPDSVDVGFINYWCSDFLTDITGRASGEVRVWGFQEPGQRVPGVWVSLKAMAHNTGLSIPYTGGRYFVNDSVFMDSLSLSFPNLTLLDTEGNRLYLDGIVTHDSDWRDIHFNMNVKTEHAIVLNMPVSDSQMYGGKVYADATCSISGDERECNIAANARTTAGSSFIFSVATASSAADNSFITFVNHDIRRVDSDEDKTPVTVPTTKVNLTIQAEVTPQTEVSVLLDEHTGDCLKGRGEGSLRFNYFDDYNISLLGTYTLQKGTFGFTFQNVIRREFQIVEGSNVTWTGNPETPDVDIKAYYHVTASLRDLFGSETSSITNRGSVPVNCMLSLSDRLNNPLIRFGIELPSSDESVTSQVRAVINTDEMLMRQVLYLLVFNRFYTPEYLQNTANIGLNETYSLLSSTVTGQINSWISRLTDMVSVGFNFRTDGAGAESSQEYEAQFQIHPVRGLLINGNFGYRHNDISNQPVFGNLDVEYMLTPDGKLRAKAYTHTVDKYSIRQANTVQGVGFVFKHEFNWPASKKPKEKDADKPRKTKADKTQ